jgi:hypothetical protein
VRRSAPEYSQLRLSCVRLQNVEITDLLQSYRAYHFSLSDAAPEAPPGARGGAGSGA